ncbi:MAG: amidase domain-containing protein [Oscillospiraceae bacterium]|jgi:hypothetical protein|nr:amidase domain-containing protein [Oscillospiraceae bacterium]
MNPTNIVPYQRKAAVDYAHTWAFGRNPKYGDFSDMGGDCSNFISQCLIAGNAVMKDNQENGWYYYSLKNRSPSWSGVPFLWKFLVTNQGRGPFGHEIPLAEAEVGDIIQLRFPDKEDYSHSLLIVDEGDAPDPMNILIAAHSYDSDYRPLNTYSYQSTRVLHIDGVRK